MENFIFCAMKNQISYYAEVYLALLNIHNYHHICLTGPEIRFYSSYKFTIQIQYQSRTYPCCKKFQNFMKNRHNVMRCAIWYHLCNLKIVKNTHGDVLLSVKSRKTSHICIFFSWEAAAWSLAILQKADAAENNFGIIYRNFLERYSFGLMCTKHEVFHQGFLN